MSSGYPRFFIQKPITSLCNLILQRCGTVNESAMLFPCSGAVSRFRDFIYRHGNDEDAAAVRHVQYTLANEKTVPSVARTAQLSAALYPRGCGALAKTFWQHTGEGISSRRAEYCMKLLEQGLLREQAFVESHRARQKGPTRYHSTETNANAKKTSTSSDDLAWPSDEDELEHHIEERYGRNLDLQLADQAKLAMQRRIAGSLTSDVDLSEALKPTYPIEDLRPSVSVDDVYLYPGGMNSIFSTHRLLLSTFQSKNPTICFGFPYIDTLKVLEKFNPSGCLFYGRGDAENLSDLERRLQDGERFLALFCEFPSNPLLRCPNLQHIRKLADKYDFLVVIDETIGNFLNVNVLPFADILVSSLTKIFSGDSNVMGGATILNPSSHHYDVLKKAWTAEYQDTLWVEDAIFLERNSRDFVSRIARINVNAEAVVSKLHAHPLVKDVYYPTTSDTRSLYDACKTPTGGYGGLLSATFNSLEDAATFFDSLDMAKGPSLGTNFTLACPFVLLAHYNELDWAQSLGVPAALVRFSMGLEEKDRLLEVIDVALEALEQSKSCKN